MDNRNNDQHEELRAGEEGAMEALLREAGPRAEPPPEIRDRIRQAVHAEWQAAVRQARPAATRPGWRRRPALAAGLAAGVAAAAVAFGIAQWLSTATPVPMARLARLEGPVEVRDATGWQPAVLGQEVTSGQDLVTGAGGKVALVLPHGVTLRVDSGTRLAMADADQVYVERGAVYLDAGPPTARVEDGLRIDSAFGRTRHLGTQYEVDVNADRMLVSVREGKVAVSRAGALSRLEAPFVASAGEQLSVNQAGTVQRGLVDRRGPQWAWIAEVTPPFAIENRRLSDFLVWVSRETGRDLRFSSSQVKAAASDIVLRGSVAGMPPDQALAAVMATTTLGYSSEGDHLVITPAAKPTPGR